MEIFPFYTFAALKPGLKDGDGSGSVSIQKQTPVFKDRGIRELIF
jgi:hypothetical protein